MDKNKQKVLNDYIVFRRLKNHSRTIKDIEFYIAMFLNSTRKPIKDFDEEVLINFIDKIKDKYSVGMLNNIKSSYLKNFIKWYFADWSARFRHLDTICKTEKTETAYKPEDMVKEEEFKKMVQGEETIFWKAYFMTLFYGACRPVEVCNLKWKEVDFNDSAKGAYLSIYSKKNKNTFIKYIPSDVAFLLKKLQNNNSEYVFATGRKNLPVGVKGAYWKIRELSQRTLGHQIDLYTLRHSIATIIYNKEYMKDTDIANQMGHTKSMKGKYVHNDIDQIKATAKKIYISPEELPPEKKHELELQIEELQNKLKEVQPLIDSKAKQDALIKAYAKEVMDKIMKDAEAKYGSKTPK